MNLNEMIDQVQNEADRLALKTCVSQLEHLFALLESSIGQVIADKMRESFFEQIRKDLSGGV
jgi:hypothetical protein